MGAPGRGSAPIARMCPAPGLHAGYVDGAFEHIAVLGFAEPALLAGCFTGGATRLFAAIVLALDIAWVGDEEMLTMPALTSSSSCHDSASPGRESKRVDTEKGTADRGTEEPEEAQEKKNDKCEIMKRGRRTKCS